MFFAFSNEQFDEGLKKLGVTKEEVYDIGLGGFIKKTSGESWYELLKRHHEEDKEAREDDDYVHQMFSYELSNHEFCVNQDPEDTLRIVGLDWEKLQKNERLLKIYLKAEEEYMKRHNNE
jgi:hypothetical protein